MASFSNLMQYLFELREERSFSVIIDEFQERQWYVSIRQEQYGFRKNRGLIVKYRFLDNNIQSLIIGLKSGFFAGKKGFVAWGAQFFAMNAVVIAVRCRGYPPWRRSSWQRRRSSGQWRPSSCRQSPGLVLRYSGSPPSFLCYRRFSGSWGFPKCLFFMSFCNKKTLIFYFLPVSSFLLSVYSGLENQNDGLDWTGILSEIEIV